MSEDLPALENANEPDEIEDQEPLSEEAAKLYLSVLMAAATKLREKGELSADAVRIAENNLRSKFPQVPPLSTATKVRMALAIRKVKPAPDDKVAAILAANPDREARSMTSLGDLLRNVVEKK